MALFAAGDLHLSLGTDKQMDMFGGGWNNYVKKISSGFSVLSENDVCVLCGDLSWGMDFEEARDDFCFINDLPGKKIILKGNHDYWWTTASGIYAFFGREGIKNIEILHNNCVLYGETAVCGTRGWFFEEEKGTGHDRKIMQREIGRLETSLKAAEGRKKFVFLHYPPKYGDYECAGILELFERYEVPVCCYGHLHGAGLRYAFRGTHRGTEFIPVSVDLLGFKPEKILD